MSKIFSLDSSETKNKIIAFFFRIITGNFKKEGYDFINIGHYSCVC